MKLSALILPTIFAQRRDFEGNVKLTIAIDGDREDIEQQVKVIPTAEIWNLERSKLTLSIDQVKLPELYTIFDKSDIKIDIDESDFSELIENDLKKRSERIFQQPSTFAYDEYLDYDEYLGWLDHVTTNHANNLTVEVLEQTVEGRDILGITIPPFAEDRKENPSIFIDCGIHAREWISPAVCRLFVHELMRCTEEHNFDKCDPILRDEFYDYNWFIIPVLNPDGYQYTWDNNRLWRKNRSQNEGSPCIGTDLNRNSDFAWGTEGASSNPCSDTFRGAGPNSEQETIAYQKFFELIEERYETEVKAYVSMHSYSQKIISSFAASRNAVPEEPKTVDQMNEAGKRISEAMTKVSNTKYEYGQARDILYPSSGSTKDWVNDKKGVPLSWTWELRDTGDYGFLLPPDQIVPNFNEVLEGIIALFEYTKEM